MKTVKYKSQRSYYTYLLYIWMDSSAQTLKKIIHTLIINRLFLHIQYSFGHYLSIFSSVVLSTVATAIIYGPSGWLVHVKKRSNWRERVWASESVRDHHLLFTLVLPSLTAFTAEPIYNYIYPLFSFYLT